MSNDARDDGGPAFPNVPASGNFGYAQTGMSLRDWFAGQAIAMFGTLTPNSVVAEEAYALADAMLKERQK